MHFKKQILLSGLAVLALSAAAAGWALADEHRGPGGRSGPPWARMGMDGGPEEIFERFDLDRDGRVTEAEITTFRSEQLRRFDGNGDGVLVLEEYRALWADAMQRPMVRGFQRHDVDGDGRVTAEEFEARFARMVDRLDRNDDGAISRDEIRPPRGER